MLTILKSLAGILSGVAITLIAILAMSPGNAAVNVSEDSPAFNCWTDGNGDCGTALIVNPDSERGAILEAANDGIVYVSWHNGDVTPATESQRKAAWANCIANADGGDASMFDCDAGFQNAGDRFTM